MRSSALLLAVAGVFTVANACGSSGSGGGATAGDGGTDGTASSGSGGSGSGGSSGAGSGGSSGGGSSGGSSGAGSGGGSGSSSGVKSDAGTVGGIVGGVPGPGVMLNGCSIFPADNPWNVAVDGPNVPITHAYDAQLPQGTHLHPDFDDFNPDGYGIPFATVPATQADQTIDFSVSAQQSDPGPGGWVGANPVTTNSDSGETKYPFFVGMKIEGNPAAGGTPGNLPGDQHGLVLQSGSPGCKLYEAWNCVTATAVPFQCANGAIFDLTSNALRPAGWTSADAAGLPILPGLVKLAEVQAGAIHHAIRVTFNSTQEGYIAPATHAASKLALGSAYPPMGLRLRLKASVAITSYHATSQVIMTAMKKYGLIVADNGTDWYFSGDSDDGWNNTAPDGQDTFIGEAVSDFGKLSGSDFEAVYTGDPVATGL